MGIFSSSRAVVVKFGCFGKLPNYGDFISLNADGPEAQALAGWLQDGVSVMPPATIAPDQTLAFVWRPAGARRTLVGALWPSADAAGRRFPFAIFAAYPDAQIAPHGVRRVLAAEAVWRQIREIHAQVTALARVGDQHARVDAAAPAIPDPRDVQRAFTERAHAARLRRDDAVPYGVELQQIGRYADALRKHLEVPDFALRMKVSDASDPVAEAAAWVQVLARRLEVDDLDAAVFLRLTRSAGQCQFVFHRSLVAADLGFVLAPGDGYRAADSVGFQGVASAAPDARALEAFQRSWTSSSPTIAGLLALAGHPLPAPEGGAAPTSEPFAVAPAPPVAAAPIVPTAAAAAPAADKNATTAATHHPFAAHEHDTGPTGAELPAPTTGGIAQPRILDDGPITDDGGGAMSGSSVIEVRINELAAGPMLAGRLIRASTSVTATSATGEAAAGETVLLYIEDGGRTMVLSGFDAPALQRVERQVADHTEALQLIEELRRLHRASEDRLQRAVEAACARTPPPGAQA